MVSSHHMISDFQLDDNEELEKLEDLSMFSVQKVQTILSKVTMKQNH